MPASRSSPGTGADFLLFTEHPRSIRHRRACAELLRQLGFWGLYVGVGFGRPVPFMGVADTYLFSVPVILATFAMPLLALLVVPRGARLALRPLLPRRSVC